VGIRTADVNGPPTPTEQAAFEGFYRREWTGAVRLSHLLTGVDAVAEDLAQESFTRVQAHWARLDNPAAYLRTTVVNRCRSWQRSRGREQTRLRLARPRGPGGEHSELGADELLDAVDALPFRQRAVLVLRYYLDLSEREIAEALDCRPGTVKSLASRALGQLRKVIDR
jgi:RNA polymerase sigma-70 factor (sigma-E family)